LLAFLFEFSHFKGFKNLNDYINKNFPQPNTFDDYVYVSQLMQAYAIGVAINAHRRAKPNCMGSLYWQLNDVWPAISWSSIDYYGVWKALHYKTKRLYRQLYVASFQENMTHTFIQEDADVVFHLISEKIEAVEAKLELKLRHTNSAEHKILFDEKLLIEAESNKIFYKFKINKEMSLGCSIRNCFLEAKIQTLDGSRRSFQYIHLFVRPVDLKLSKLENLVILFNEKSTLRIHSKVFVYGLYLYLEGDLMLNLDDNYFDLLPGETKILTILEIDDHADLESELRYKSLNEVS
jgi:beta-mannosidase